MRSEPRRPGRPQSAGLLREPGAARGREPGGPGAPASPGHRAGSGCGAARARPPQGAPPSWRCAVRPGREEAGARVPARGARANGGACAQGPRSRRLGSPGRAVPEPHVRGAGRRQWLPVGRLVPPEPGKGRPPRRLVGTGVVPRRLRLLGRSPADSQKDTELSKWGRADMMLPHIDFTAPRLGEREALVCLSWASIPGSGSHRSAVMGLWGPNHPASPA